jgi:hypothetical protein
VRGGGLSRGKNKVGTVLYQKAGVQGNDVDRDTRINLPTRHAQTGTQTRIQTGTRNWEVVSRRGIGSGIFNLAAIKPLLASDVDMSSGRFASCPADCFSLPGLSLSRSLPDVTAVRAPTGARRARSAHQQQYGGLLTTWLDRAVL